TWRTRPEQTTAHTPQSTHKPPTASSHTLRASDCKARTITFVKSSMRGVKVSGICALAAQIAAFHVHDFCHALAVARFGTVRRQKDAHNVERGLGADHPRAQGEDVGVIMLA